MPVATVVKTVLQANTHMKVNNVINAYIAWLGLNPIYDLCNESNGFSPDKFPRGFLSVEQEYRSFESMANEITATQVINNLNSGMVPNLLTRCLLLDRHALEDNILSKVMPGGETFDYGSFKGQKWKIDLSRIQDQGLRDLCERAFAFAGYCIVNDKQGFLALDFTNRAEVYRWFGSKITSSAIVYLLKYFRDALNFKLIVQATVGNTMLAGFNHANSDIQARYSGDIQRLSKRLMHLLKVKCTHIVMEAYSYIIDNDEDIVDFLADKSLFASVIEDFKGLYERLDRTASWFVLIGDWPVDTDPSFKKKKKAGPSASSAPVELDWSED